ncbi:MAG TPA: L,D-transpeptidase [Aquabacterium sp.]|uniref:L,D-transpeptidase n=1 Tax=Aquabacterium sp. TaxID=1872578 RepID=UPI002E357DD7|nr:L,D-transpeptidase [Aquabacterium sp.]HEX5357933.1 L,D-transpeptidase [Aquabacterium sp.]
MVVALPPCLARAAEPAAEAAWHIASIGPTTRNYVQHILSTGDHEGLPFAIVDKVASTIQVYRADGSLVGTSSVLLGQTRGDTIVPGTGERTQTRQLRPMDRTTPAGRFYSEPGHNQVGEAVVWIDYAAALAIHRLRPGLPQEKRAQRMASGNPLDKRISAGCVVVPVAFYLDVVQPTLGHNKGIVYVMTENGDQPR